MTDQLPAEDRAFARYRERGDVDALGEVFDHLAPALLRFARGLLDDPQHAEDVVQQAFVVAIEGRAQWDAERPLLPWLLGVVAHRARNLGRRERRRAGVDLTAAAPLSGDDPDPAQAAAADEVVAVVQDAIDALPEPYGPVLDLHLRHGMTAAEIARSMRRPAVTVRSQIRRGMQLLRAALPAGLAAAGAGVVLPNVALAAMRGAVLERARAIAAESAVSGAGVVTSATAFGLPVAALMLNKSLLVGLAALLVVGISVTLATWPGDGTGGVSASPDRGPSMRAAAAVDAVLPPPNGAAAVVRSEVASAPEGPSVPAAMVVGELVVQVLQDWDGAPADLVTVVVPDASGELVTLVTAEDGLVRCPAVTTGRRVELPDFGQVATVGEPGAGLTFRVPPRLDLMVLVEDPAGEPVAEAEVFQFLGLGPDLHRLTLGRTDGRGTVRVRTARPLLSLRARAAGHLPGQQQLVMARRAPSGPVRVQVGAAAPVATVEVMTSTGASVADAKLLVFLPEEFRQHPLLAQTDADGRAHLVVPSAGDLLVLAVVGADADARFRLVDWPAPRAASLRVIVQPSAWLSGRITDTTGRSLGGVRVHARWQDERLPDAFTRGFRGVTVTDAEGRYELRGLLPGSAALRLQAAGVSEVGEIVLESARGSEWSPVVAPPNVWRLRIEEPSGAPLQGWLVEVRATAPGAELQEAITDADGQVSFPAPADRVDVRVRGSAVGGSLDAAFDAALQHRWVGVTTAATERLVVPADRLPTAELRGVLVDAAGAPLAGVEVQVLRQVEGRPEVQTLRSAADGSFVLGPTAPGSLTLAARHGGHAVLRSDVQLLPARITDLGTLVLAAGGRVSVQVTATLAAPHVRLRLGANTPPLELRRDADGHYVTPEPLPAGDYLLELLDGERLVTSRQIRVAGGGTLVHSVSGTK